jgi:thioredoxin-like negative regulator of GroEL
MKKTISILLAVVLLATVFAGCKSKKSESDFSAMQNVQAMLEYAEELEANGQHEAAAQIYAMLPDAANEAAAEEGQKLIESDPNVRIAKGADEARDILNDVSDIVS